ncbi:unnamed protein product [Orchesella dallaii]|uniref:Gustatory receptor n=1 Tax=Orchesella dallaii TaxID=48710 RepID=A0ABP1Q3P2_9HEXA
MQNTYLIYILSLNEIVSRVGMHPTYFYYWNSKERKLNSETKWQRVIPWLISQIVASIYLIIVVPIVILRMIYQLNNSDEVVCLDRMFAYLLQTLVLLLSYGLNLTFYHQRKSIVGYLNQLLYYHEEFFKKRFASRFWKEFAEIKKINRESFDVIGWFQIYLVLYLGLIPAIATLVVSYFDLNSPYMSSLYIIPANLQKDIVDTTMYKLLMAILSYFLHAEACRTLRHSMTAVIHASSLTVNITNRHLSQSNSMSLAKRINDYRIFTQVHSQSVTFSTMISILMGMGYIITVISGAISLVGWMFLRPVVYFVFPLTWLVVIITTVTTLTAIPYCACFNEGSTQLLEKLRLDVKVLWGKQRRLLLCLLKTLKPVKFYCGNVGPICRESNTLFLVAIIADTSSLLLLCKLYMLE